MNKIYCDTQWNSNGKDESIYDSPPQDETIKEVLVDDYEGIDTSSDVLLLWTPIESELNGWDDHPEQVLNSYIIKVRVLEKQNTEFSDTKKYRVKILDSSKITENPTEKKLKFSFPVCLDTTVKPEHEYILWEKAHWSGYYEQENYIFITAVQYETHLDTILIEHKNYFDVIYHSVSYPVGSDAFWGSYKTSKKERKMFQDLIERSINLKENVTSD